MSTLAMEDTAVAAGYRLAARVLGEELDDCALRWLHEIAEWLPNRLDDPPPSDILNAPTEQALTSTAVEFCRLFVGPRPVVRVCPDTEDRIARSARDAMRKTLAASGLRVTETSRIPAEHLAVWLSILADGHGALARSAAAESDASTMLARVATSSIGDWLNQTLSVVEADAEVWPYRPIARAALGLLDLTRADCANRGQ